MGCPPRSTKRRQMRQNRFTIQLHRVRQTTIKKCSEKRLIKVVLIDFGKIHFQVHVVDDRGLKQLTRQMRRKQLRATLVKLPECLIGKEACASAHYWAQLFRGCGHEVKLIAPQFVKPYEKSNTNDRADAEAICEAVQCPHMHFVAFKKVEQEDVQNLHLIRRQVVTNRTAQVNQIRGPLLEYGINITEGRVHVCKQLPRILENAKNGLPIQFSAKLSVLYEKLVRLDEHIAELNQQIDRLVQENDCARRVMTIPGIAPKDATTLAAAIGDIHTFKNARELAAYLGLVPCQCSTVLSLR